MSKIYELDIKLYNVIHKWPTNDKFIFTDKKKKDVVVVDNSNGNFFVENYSNKIKGLIYLANDEFLTPEVEEEYKKNKKLYESKYKNVVASKEDYMFDYDLYNRDFIEFDPNKKYEFDINIGYGAKKFKATIRDALGLASNYESDLGFKGHLIFSPLGFEWEENRKLKERYLGKENGDIPLPYRYPHSKEIEWITEEKNIKI